MKRDIFETLKHGNCGLKIVKKGDEYLLGCVDCGTTIYSTKDEDILDELIEAYRICKKESAYNMAVYIEKLIFKTEFMQEIVMKCFEDEYEEGYIFTQAFSYTSPKCEKLKEVGISMEEGIVNEIKEAIENKEPFATNKLFVESGESFTISNKIITNNPSDYYKNILIIDLEKAELLEKEYPTDKTLLKVNNVDEFLSSIPKFLDEEEENYDFNKFIYKMENDLIDFSDLSKEDKERILKSSLEYFFGFEYCVRHELLIKRILKLLNINI